LKIHLEKIDMGKYSPLADFLRERRSQGGVRLSFEQIEQIINGPLPKSASDHQAWWANELTPHGHTQARAWIDEGFKVVGLNQLGDNRWVEFRTSSAG
jgi:hypothetical protein